MNIRVHISRGRPHDVRVVVALIGAVSVVGVVIGRGRAMSHVFIGRQRLVVYLNVSNTFLEVLLLRQYFFRKLSIVH